MAVAAVDHPEPAEQRNFQIGGRRDLLDLGDLLTGTPENGEVNNLERNFIVIYP